MTKAEQRALKAYPDQSHDLLHTPSWRYERNIYVKGYEQAEKDLVLTWEDLRTINDLFNKVDSENIAAWDYEVIEQDLPFPYGQKFYEEVLRRFRETKNK